jgi:uncharacterized protein (TIGR02453 family)
VAGFFGKDLFDFLSDLREHNDREWFQENRERYEGALREPFLDFITAAGGELAKINPNIVADPRPQGGSLFRIYRDVRFSKDKSPYKTHAGAHFPVGGKDVHGPGYYLHLEPRASFVAAGMWMPGNPTLTKIRDAIVAEPKEWKRIRGLLGEDESRLKRPPRGYDPDHPFIEDLKRKSFTGGSTLSQKDVLSPGFMKVFIERCREVTPLVGFLAKAVGAPW